MTTLTIDSYNCFSFMQEIVGTILFSLLSFQTENENFLQKLILQMFFYE
jgi:hypothetical protein